MRTLSSRLRFFLVTLWAALTINYILPRLMPGSAVESMMLRFRGRVDPAALHSMEVAFGTSSNGSFLGDYLKYIGNTFTGHFGVSVLFFPVQVKQVLLDALPWTIGLIGVTTVIAFLFGTLLGMVAAWRRGGFADSVLLPATLVTSAFPYFWLALIALYVFTTKLAWLPGDFSYDVSNGASFSLSFIGDVVYHAILPGLTIIVTSVGGWFLLMRNNMLGTLAEDYVRMARAKGLSTRRVMMAYAGRNAILPSVTGFALAIGFVISGALLTEVVFNYPGIGFLLYQAVTNQDYPLMQTIFFFITLTVLGAAILADIANALLDPRTRTAR